MPFAQEIYEQMVTDTRLFRTHLDLLIEEYPELFPEEITSGYHFHDRRSSKKLEGVTIRRIKLQQANQEKKEIVLSIQPSFVMPYMTGLTESIEKALFLTQYAVPLSALTYLFGHNDQYWYRMMTQFGRYGIVQTTVQQPENMPKQLLADEKHSRFNGQKCYVATTAGEDCILGASISLNADEAHLLEAYSDFKDEATQLDPDYQPESVNTDGWAATQKAWLLLFPAITIIECFLHAFISIRSRCKKKWKDVWPLIQQQVWDIYDSQSAKHFLAQTDLLFNWAEENLDGEALKAVKKLCTKAPRFAQWYKHPDARRTSNMIDRLMIPMDRWLATRRYFHGHLISAEKAIRSWALLKNFMPYCPRAKVSKDWRSPVHKLNGKIYHGNWLHNLLISTSNSPVFTLSHIKQQN